MAVTFKHRICDLVPEFFADAFVFFGTFQPAGAIASGALQSLLDCLHHFPVFVQTNSHEITSFELHYKRKQALVKKICFCT